MAALRRSKPIAGPVVPKSKRKYDWRKGIKIHPAADLFPMMGSDQLDELAGKIKENGLQLPPVFYLTKTGERWLLDGRNRLEACSRAGINPDFEGKEVHEGKVDPYRSYVISANVTRRHLTPRQRRDLIARVIEETQKSDRAIAKEVGASHQTVARVRQAAKGTKDGENAERHEASGRKARGRKPGARVAKQPSAPLQIVAPETPPAADMTEPTSPLIEARAPCHVRQFNALEQGLKLLSAFSNSIEETNNNYIAAFGNNAIVAAFDALMSGVENAKQFVERAGIWRGTFDFDPDKDGEADAA